MSRSGSEVAVGCNEFANVLIKPDGMADRHYHYIRKRILDSGLYIVAEKRFKISPAQAEKHYDKSKEWCEKYGAKRNASLRARGSEVVQSDLECGQEILAAVRSQLSSGTVCGFIVYGVNANTLMRELAGPTDPEEARRANRNHIRALSSDSFARADDEVRPVRNLIHVSETEEEALKEIMNLWPALLRLFRHLLGATPDALHILRVHLESEQARRLGMAGKAAIIVRLLDIVDQ